MFLATQVEILNSPDPFVFLAGQVEILDSPDPFVFLAGPPGSGKTLLLGLKAEKWAKDNCNVVIVSATGESCRESVDE